MLQAQVHAEKTIAKLEKIRERLLDLSTVHTQIGRHMMISVRQNFDVGGRPERWVDLKEVEVLPKGNRSRRRRVQGRARLGGPLVLTGDLRRSIGFTAEKDRLILWDRPSENWIKAPVHQKGSTGRHIPARPFLVVQQDDRTYARDVMSGWVRVGADALARLG